MYAPISNLFPGTSLTFVCWLASSCVATWGRFLFGSARNAWWHPALDGTPRLQRSESQTFQTPIFGQPRGRKKSADVFPPSFALLKTLVGTESSTGGDGSMNPCKVQAKIGFSDPNGQQAAKLIVIQYSSWVASVKFCETWLIAVLWICCNESSLKPLYGQQGDRQGISCSHVQSVCLPCSWYWMVCSLPYSNCEQCCSLWHFTVSFPHCFFLRFQLWPARPICTNHLSFRQLCAVGRWCSFFWSICLWGVSFGTSWPTTTVLGVKQTNWPMIYHDIYNIYIYSIYTVVATVINFSHISFLQTWNS